MSSGHLVSVCITVFNGEQLIARALDSVRDQTLSDYELLVLDDGSEDRSSEIALSYGAHVIRQHNCGVGVARQRLLEEAKGEWIAFLDHDDRWESTYLERITGFSTLESDVFRYAWIHHDDLEGNVWAPEIPRRIGTHAFGHVLPQRIWPTASIFRREALLTLGGFRPELKACEDWLAFFELASKGTFAYLDERLATVMRRRGSTSAPTRRYFDFERTVLEDHVLPRFDVMYPDMALEVRAMYLRETNKKLGLILSLIATLLDHEGRRAEAAAMHRRAIRLAPGLKGVWYRGFRSLAGWPAPFPFQT